MDLGLSLVVAGSNGPARALEKDRQQTGAGMPNDGILT